MSIPATFLNQMFIRRVLAFSASSLLIYDYLITFSLEVIFIWDSPWTFVKALFLVNRYGNLIGQTFIMLEETGCLSHKSQKFCSAHALFSTFFSVFSGESIRILVVMRACAILGCKRSIARLVNGVYVVFSITILTLSLYYSRDTTGTEFPYLSETGVCFSPVAPNSWHLWVVPLLLDLFVVAIVCFSLFRAVRFSRNYQPSRLIRLLARDAVWFYSVALFNALFFVLCWIFYYPDPRNALSSLFTYPIISVVGQRLVLNLRRFRVRPESMRDISQEIRRQVAGIISEAESPLDPHLYPYPGMELGELGKNRRMP